MNAMHGMVQNKNKEEVGRKMLVDGIKEAGIKHISFLTLPSEECADVLLLNKEFGAKNVKACGFEKLWPSYCLGKQCAPENLQYHYDYAGGAFMREATSPESSAKYNVIDFEFCGAYGSPNHATIEQLVKLVQSKVYSGSPAVIAATYNLSAPHFGKERSLSILGQGRFDWNDPICSFSTSYPDYYDGILEYYQEPLQFDINKRVESESKRKSVVLSQAIVLQLYGELMDKIPLNKYSAFPFTVHFDLYSGGSGNWNKQSMLRIVIVVNPNYNPNIPAGTSDLSRQWHALTNDGYPNWSFNMWCFFPMYNGLPLENKRNVILKYIQYYFGGNVPASLNAKNFGEGYGELKHLFGFSRSQIAAFHTTNMGTWRKNLRKSA